ncbi:hypothetical protein EV363DRAFT_1435828 [Boletus edulis]|uniref:Uncharacterized protein n=1 Tax=Boletus edulis BED1 TaxID=1328754 RepID=A0AAD4BCI6_BOLED|nr:hypothetical protein EV363DRAFT_1435828 [Boletus edulis]KAF8420326.1 hypothetical protein L210DRAFT_357844 [Boletus edulis BED1]
MEIMNQLRTGMPPLLRYIGITNIPISSVLSVVEIPQHGSLDGTLAISKGQVPCGRMARVVGLCRCDLEGFRLQQFDVIMHPVSASSDVFSRGSRTQFFNTDAGSSSLGCGTHSLNYLCTC